MYSIIPLSAAALILISSSLALMDGDTEALNDFMINRANDIKNMTIDEIEGLPQDILINELENEIKK